MKRGMIFDLHQDGQLTKRVMAVSDSSVMELSTGLLINDIDFQDEVDKILIDNIFEI